LLLENSKKSGYGKKQDKIVRIMLDDDVDRDTGDKKLAELYAHVSVLNWINKRCIEEQQKLFENHRYMIFTDSELRALVQRTQEKLLWEEPVITNNNRPAMLKRALDYRFNAPPLNQAELHGIN
jgi:hypothetical protein